MGTIGLLDGHVRWATSLTNGSLAVDLGDATVVLSEATAPGITWTNLVRHDGSDELITVSDDGSLTRWELAADPPRKVAEAVLEYRPQRITAVHVATRPGSSPTLHLGHDNGLVGEWALDGSVVTPSRQVSSEAVTSLASDGELVLVGTRTGTLVVMGQDGSLVVPAAHSGTVQAILPVRVGHSRRVVIGSSDGWLTIVDPSTSHRPHDIADLDAPINDLLLLPGGTHVAAATDRGVVVMALAPTQ